jgi:hypothetical protein
VTKSREHHDEPRWILKSRWLRQSLLEVEITPGYK